MVSLFARAVTRFCRASALEQASDESGISYPSSSARSVPRKKSRCGEVGDRFHVMSLREHIEGGQRFESVAAFD
jgi:hypothetical protein